MKVACSTTQFEYSLIALVLMSICASPALEQGGQSHKQTQQNEVKSDQQNKASGLIKLVREATARFQDVAEAEKEGYALQFGCVSGPDSGAMGLHFVNGELVKSGIIDV